MLKPFSSAHLDRAHKYRVSRFQCQLKLESVTFFSVSRFLLCTETWPHTKMHRTRHSHVSVEIKMSRILQENGSFRIWLPGCCCDTSDEGYRYTDNSVHPCFSVSLFMKTILSCLRTLRLRPWSGGHTIYPGFLT